MANPSAFVEVERAQRPLALTDAAQVPTPGIDSILSVRPARRARRRQHRWAARELNALGSCGRRCGWRHPRRFQRRVAPDSAPPAQPGNGRSAGCHKRCTANAQWPSLSSYARVNRSSQGLQPCRPGLSMNRSQRRITKASHSDGQGANFLPRNGYNS